MGLGEVYSLLSQHSVAIGHYQQAFFILQWFQYRNGMAKALIGLRKAYSALSQHENAISHYQRALPILQQDNLWDYSEPDTEYCSRLEVGKLFVNIGDSYYLLSDYSKALASYQQALPIFRYLGYFNDEATTLMSMGNIYNMLSEHSKALVYYEQALPIFRKVKSLDREGLILSNIGDLLKTRRCGCLRDRLPVFLH